MRQQGSQRVFDRRFVRHLWHLIRIYWMSPDARRGVPLLAAAIALELGTVFGTFLISDAERRIMDALQASRAAAFFSAMGFFAAVSGGFILVAAYRIYLRQLVEIRWRRSVTAHYVDRWVSARAYWQNQLHGDAVDNPDQRVAEDVRDFVASALGLSLSLLASVASLVAFGGLLWTVSAHWRLPVRGGELHIPGFLLWVALLYAALSIWLTHVVGRRLVGLNFERLRYEADFRYGLMRFRDNVEVVTLSAGDALERQGAHERFRQVMRNWWQLIAAQRRLTIFTGVAGQANAVVPLLVAAPGFFAGLITLGIVVQIRLAYGQVSGALNWFVYAYQEVARWRANVERLAGFSEVIDTTAQDLERSQIRIVSAERAVLQLTDLRLETPEGDTLIDAATAIVNAGESVAITGPASAGKTILLRAIAGMWPFGAGRIDVPASARMLFVPQWPYLPLGSLRTVISYPAPAGTFSDERIAEVLRLLELDQWTARLDSIAPWDQQLTPHEQQRLALARVLLNEPEWVFLDQATSEFDAETEKRVYELLAARLPRSSLISVTQRPAVGAYHARRWTIVPNEYGPPSLQTA